MKDEQERDPYEAIGTFKHKGKERGVPGYLQEQVTVPTVDFQDLYLSQSAPQSIRIVLPRATAISVSCFSLFPTVPTFAAGVLQPGRKLQRRFYQGEKV